MYHHFLCSFISVFFCVTFNPVESRLILPSEPLELPNVLCSHYTTRTAKTLAFNTDAEDIFTNDLVTAAFDYPYLLYMVLALAAVHIDYLEGHARNGNMAYRIQAEQYHDAAITNFRETVRDIDATNFQPILMFAGILFPHLCAASISAQTDMGQNFESILSNLILTRRVRPMVGRFYKEMKASNLGRLIPDDVQGIDFNGKEPPAETELVQLRKFSEVVHHVYPPDIVDAYAQAIHLLEVVFDRAAESPDPPSDALLKIWMHLVTDRYIELLSERQPGSLIIFAHFAVLIRRSVRYWYFEGFAEQVLATVDTLVPTEWKAWLDWPKEQIWGRNSVPAPG